MNQRKWIALVTFRGVYFPLFGKIIYGIITNFRGIPEKFFETVEKKNQ